MKFLTTLVAVAAAFSGVEAAYKGFNIGANNPDGSCKTVKQWGHAFKKLKHLPQHFKQVRLYAASDCNTLAHAVPAAKKHGVNILVGVWAEDEAHYNAEKNALKAAIHKHGHKWITAISVGSEDLYRGNTDPNTLAGQIYDVRGMVRAMGVHAPVGHVDTWTAWVNTANDPTIHACDFIGMDGYPYFQGAAIQDAKKVFFQSLSATRKAVHAVKPNIKVWVTETGHPYKGGNQGASHPSVKNARRYWKEVGCQLMKHNVPMFWYDYQDYTANPAFGTFGKKGHPVHSMKC